MCGRRGTFGTFIDVRGSSAITVDPWTPSIFYVAGVQHTTLLRLDLRGRRSTFSTFIDVRGRSATTVDPWTPTVFYVAGVTLSAPQARCVWQAWRVPCLHRCPRKLGDDGGPMDADCLLRGRRDTFSTRGSMCVARSVPSQETLCLMRRANSQLLVLLIKNRCATAPSCRFFEKTPCLQICIQQTFESLF